jgi:hypothetical protein
MFYETMGEETRLKKKCKPVTMLEVIVGKVSISLNQSNDIEVNFMRKTLVH